MMCTSVIKLKERTLAVFVLCAQLQYISLLVSPLFTLFYIQHNGLSNCVSKKQTNIKWTDTRC